MDSNFNKKSGKHSKQTSQVQKIFNQWNQNTGTNKIGAIMSPPYYLFIDFLGMELFYKLKSRGSRN